jgi:dipeptidyl-peptidase 4
VSRPLTPLDVARYPRPGTAVPAAIRFSPDGSLVTCLASPDGSLTQALLAIDAATGARRVLFDPANGGVRDETVSRDEALRRERLRERGLGVTSYEWAEKRRRLLVPVGGRLHVVDLDEDRRGEIDVAPGAPPVDARLSPCGRFVAYVQDAELHVAECFGGAPRRVTSGARGTGRTNGLAEYVAQEEMGRHHGWWWSGDSRFLAFEEADETHIPVYRIVHQGKDAVGDAAREDHRYPFAGAANAKVRLGVVPREGGAPVWMDLGGAEYLARVTWFPDGSLVAQLEDRSQTRLRVVRFDPATGRATPLFEEASAHWINLHDMLRPLAKGSGDLAGGFLWASEKSGFRHLELRARDGRRVRELTRGEWMVDAVKKVDEDGGAVWFLATKDGVTERHLYVVPLAGGEPRRVTEAPGMHEAAIDAAARRFVDVHHALDLPPVVTLRSTRDGGVVARLFDGADDPRVAELGLVPPELHTLRARDGATLHAALYAPEGRGPHPLIVSVYGGPHVQRVFRGWELTIDLRAQYLRQLGYAVLVVDNRGSSRRGVAFEGSIRHAMGGVEVRDQEDGVRWAVARGVADPRRVGVYGWSYGGYMSLMCLARAPETFRAAVAGAPVTDWDGYDTHYTERYMGLPAENASGYRESSVMTHVPAMRGELMLVHGLLDENVHFRHTARLVNALNRARKRHELLMLPDERHMPRDETGRAYVEERMRDFFAGALADGTSIRPAVAPRIPG